MRPSTAQAVGSHLALVVTVADNGPMDYTVSNHSPMDYAVPDNGPAADGAVSNYRCTGGPRCTKDCHQRRSNQLLIHNHPLVTHLGCLVFN